jgi:hypothetical protein
MPPLSRLAKAKKRSIELDLLIRDIEVLSTNILNNNDFRAFIRAPIVYIKYTSLK